MRRQQPFEAPTRKLLIRKSHLDDVVLVDAICDLGIPQGAPANLIDAAVSLDYEKITRFERRSLAILSGHADFLHFGEIEATGLHVCNTKIGRAIRHLLAFRIL